MITQPATLLRPGLLPGQLRRYATLAVAVGCWILAVAALVLPIPSAVTRCMVAVAMAVTLPDISRPLRIPLLAGVLVLAALTVASGDLSPLAAGLDFAGPLAGFLVSINVLRAALTGGAGGALARARLDALRPPSQRSAVLLLSFGLSAVFLVGVFPLLAPMLTSRDRAEHQKLAAAALFGGSLAFLWSPFGVGMAFATATLGIVPGPGTTAFTLAAALSGLALGLLVHGRLNAAVLRQTAYAVRPLLAPLGLAVTATLIASVACSLRVTQVVPAVAPVVIALLALRTDAKNAPAWGPVRDALAAVPSCGGALRDLTLFAVGFALARVLTDSDVFAVVTDVIPRLPIAGCVPAALVAITVVLGLLGVPAVVCAGLVAASSTLLMPGAPVPVRLVLVLYAWASASMLSVTSGTLTVVASSFGVALRPLVLGRNLFLIAAFGALLAALASVAS